MKPGRFAAAALLATAALAGCAAAPAALAGAEPETLEGTTWRPLLLGGASVGDSGRAMLRFAAGGALEGNDGCNGLGGRWSAAGGALTFTLGPSTLMACPPPIDAIAKELRAAMESTRRFARDGSRLSLMDERGSALAVLAPTEPRSLVESSWIVRSLHDGKQGIVSVPAGVTITARFGADGKVSGSAGCNEYGGAYIAEGSELAFSPLRVTRKACPGEAMAQETRFLAGMERVVRYRLGQRELELLDADGARLADLVAAP